MDNDPVEHIAVKVPLASPEPAVARGVGGAGVVAPTWDAHTLWFAALLALTAFGLAAGVVVLLRERWYVLAALFAYPALSLVPVIWLYLQAARGQNPGPWLKGLRGGVALQALVLPFRMVAWWITALSRVVRRGPAISEIAPGLYLGVRLFRHEDARLRALGVHHVVDLCAELPTNDRLARAPFERFGVPTLDRCAPLPDEIDRAAEWVAARRAAGQAVYIHCAFGRGRSATVAAAVLLRLAHARTADEAVEMLVRARPVVSVKGPQYVALARYAETLRARGLTPAQA